MFTHVGGLKWRQWFVIRNNQNKKINNFQNLVSLIKAPENFQVSQKIIVFRLTCEITCKVKILCAPGNKIEPPFYPLDSVFVSIKNNAKNLMEIAVDLDDCR